MSAETEQPTAPAPVQPDASRVIARLQGQLGEAFGQIAMLEDVVTQLQAERARAALPPAPDREEV